MTPAKAAASTVAMATPKAEPVVAPEETTSTSAPGSATTPEAASPAESAKAQKTKGQSAQAQKSTKQARVTASDTVTEAAHAAAVTAAENVDEPRHNTEPVTTAATESPAADTSSSAPETPQPGPGAEVIAENGSAGPTIADRARVLWGRARTKVTAYQRLAALNRAEKLEEQRAAAEAAAVEAAAAEAAAASVAAAAESAIAAAEAEAEPTRDSSASADVQAKPAPSALGTIDETVPADRTPVADTAQSAQSVVTVSGLRKEFGETIAVDSIDLDVPAGTFYGIVGPNGAGKTTTLSMITGLLRPDAGTVHVNGINVWEKTASAKRTMGTLPDRMRLFDRLTGAQLLYYSGVLRGLDSVSARSRVKSLTRAFALEDAVGRLVSDYSAGMSKKIALACAMIHSPRVLVLDEPFESVDPVSAASITEILQKYVEHGGTVILSSHGMEFIERVCDNVAIIVGGELLASGTVDEVRKEGTLEERFVELVGGRKATEDLEWLHSFSD